MTEHWTTHLDRGAADSTFPDPSFHYVGSGGGGIEAIPNGIAVAPNWDIVVVGDQMTFAQSGTTTVNDLALLTSSGELDSTFGNGGTMTNSLPAGTAGLQGVVIQADDKIVTNRHSKQRADRQPLSR